MFKQKLVVSALCLSLAACGAATETTEQVRDLSSDEATTTSLLLPPDAAEQGEAVPVVEDPVGLASENPNDPSTAVGALCWARWEVSRVLLAQVLKPMAELTEDSRAAQLDTDVKSAIERATKPELREFVLAGSLPEELSQFADAMFRMYDEAIVGDKDLATALDYEQLPGADAYMKYASEVRECPNR